MDIDRDNSPSIKSDTSQLSYTNDFDTLPANGPVSHAHIIDIDESQAFIKGECSTNLQDAIVTSLVKLSPTTLRSFMSPTVHNFKAIFGKKDIQLVIWRKGLEVFVGTFEHHTSMKAYRFEQVAGFLIGYDGSWHLKVTASNAYCNAKWPEVWTGKFYNYGGVAQMTVEVEETDMAKRASKLAGAIISGKYWELKSDVKLS
ncbi:hypothetical protein T440DRAFT_488422 [Plenodomus tracheiphilus IPT5]|uniref:Uncharacterized protein n=1 Tax=Plenodomus tracheiphilus IPT5 TaxID=1408161 RepID=A0A6A7BA26_9PLEO|nr:hypothetical protein T440DRAFT_488422 [Plenodomus tracheiphilus IPT5]